MKKSILSLLLSMIALGCLAQVSQGAYFQKRNSEATLIKFGMGGPSQSVTDHIIRRISQATGKPLQSTELILIHDEVLRLTYIDQHHFQVMASLENFHVEGDQAFLGFDLSNYLKPAAIKFKLRLRNGLDKVKQTWNYDAVAMGGEPAVIANFRQTDSTAFRRDKLELIEKSFIFNEGSRNLFDGQVNLIEEYYAASNELDVLYQQMEQVNPSDFEHLPEQEAQLAQINEKLAVISQKNYPGRLGLTPQFDPAQFLSMFHDLQQFSADREAQMAETVAQLPFLIHQRGLAALQQGQRDQARRDFNYALEIAPNFPPALLELARMELNDGNRANAMPRLLAITSAQQVDAETRNGAIQLLGNVQNEDLAAIRRANSGKDFETALSMLATLNEYCASVPELDCERRSAPEFSAAHQGIYQRHLQQARTALDQNNLGQAREKAILAMDYQKQFPDFIQNSNEAQQALNQIHLTMYRNEVARANQSLQAGQLDQAEQAIDAAMELASAHPQAIPAASEATQLLNRVKEARYQMVLAEGRSLLQAKQHSSALDKFEQAMQLEREFRFTKDPKLPGDAQEAARVVVLDMMDDALRSAASNQLPRARENANAATALRNQYNLQQDQAILEKTQLLQSAIFDQECANAQSQYQGTLAAAQEMRTALRFIDAERIYNEALQVIQNNNACSLDRTAAQRGLTEVANAAQYQRDLQAAKEQVSSVQYRNAVQTYEQAERNFERANLGQHGLAHRPLLEFFLERNRNEFTLYGVGLFTDRKEYEGALQLSRQLALMGYPKSRYKAVQFRLGQELAARDHGDTPSANPKSAALRHTKGSKLLKFVYKGYVKTWKKL